VPAFGRDAFFTHELDFRLAVDGPVTLFWSPAVLSETVGWLARSGYTVITVDSSACTSQRDLHRALASALNFPDYYGHNLAALNDCLSDVVTYEYASSPAATGFVLVLNHYDALATLQPDFAHAVLDVYARQARSAALIGHRMLCLVQSNDPDLRFEAVGASRVGWNSAEWLDTTRHPPKPR